MADEESERWWRTVLGEYPTGVTLLTTALEDGARAGMVVGTFSAVSADPPLVSFLARTGSRAYGEVASSGRVVANVLGSGHEKLCRSFAGRGEDRFETASWTTTETGLPRLTDAVAWFEGTLRDPVPAGDHAFVLADVTAFGVGDGSAGMPLLFLKGGYGSFSVPSLSFDVLELHERLRTVDEMREVTSVFAVREGVRCELATVVGDSVVVVSSANLRPDARPGGSLGLTFPFAGPVAAALAAWASEEVQAMWTEGSRHLVGRVERPLLASVLKGVRARGYAITLGSSMSERFDEVILDPASTRADLVELWSNAVADLAAADGREGWYRDVTAVQLPVLDAQGHAVYELVMEDFPAFDSLAGLEALVDRGREVADELGALVRAEPPAR